MHQWKQGEQLAAQLRGLLYAPDVRKDVLPNGIELFTTHDLLKITATKQLLGIAPHKVFGKRMEQLLKHAILVSERYEVIAENIQIIENGLTIGELDFILYDLLHNKLIHLELAVKFYVYDPALPEELQRWIGPNRRDSLVRKMDKLKNKQFPLLYRPETQITLQNLNLPDLPMAQALCFKSLLYVPEGQRSFMPKNLNPKVISGTWVQFSDFHLYREHSFYLPEKPEWICDPFTHEIWNDYEQTYSQLEALVARKRSTLCWMKAPEGDIKTFFLVWW